jgi:hypothetical protein
MDKLAAAVISDWINACGVTKWVPSCFDVIVVSLIVDFFFLTYDSR